MDRAFILIAEDDADDRFLLRSAFKENNFNDELLFVENGVELMDYLYSADRNSEAIFPHFILLDLNMPKKDGREALREIKQNERFKQIPVIIFSTTNNEIEMKRCYELGANSYITKPNSFENLIRTVASIRNVWMNPNSPKA